MLRVMRIFNAEIIPYQPIGILYNLSLTHVEIIIVLFHKHVLGYEAKNLFCRILTRLCTSIVYEYANLQYSMSFKRTNIMNTNIILKHTNFNRYKIYI